MFSRDKFGQRNRFRQRDIYITKQKIALDNFLGLKWIPKCFKTHAKFELDWFSGVIKNGYKEHTDF